MPVDHFSLTVPASKLEEVATFLVESLKHMGFKEHIRPIPNVVGMGDKGAYFWLNTVDAEAEEGSVFQTVLKKTHIAFNAETTEQVRQFHAAALKAGGTCNGPPGLRPHFHPSYYGAFVHDPACGVNFEVVCHKGSAG